MNRNSKAGSLPRGVSSEDLFQALDFKRPSFAATEAKFSINDRSDAISFSARITNASGTVMRSVSRALSLKPSKSTNGTISPKQDHDYMSFTEKYRGMDISKSLWRAGLPRYDELKIIRIDVHASLDNVHSVWARYGFQFKAATVRTIWVDRYAEHVAVRAGINNSKAVEEFVCLDAPQEFLAHRWVVNGVAIDDDEFKKKNAFGWDGTIDITPGTHSREALNQSLRIKT